MKKKSFLVILLLLIAPFVLVCSEVIPNRFTATDTLFRKQLADSCLVKWHDNTFVCNLKDSLNSYKIKGDNIILNFQWDTVVITNEGRDSVFCRYFLIVDSIHKYGDTLILVPNDVDRTCVLIPVGKAVKTDTEKAMPWWLILAIVAGAFLLAAVAYRFVFRTKILNKTKAKNKPKTFTVRLRTNNIPKAVEELRKTAQDKLNIQQKGEGIVFVIDQNNALYLDEFVSKLKTEYADDEKHKIKKMESYINNIKTAANSENINGPESGSTNEGISDPNSVSQEEKYKKEIAELKQTIKELVQESEEKGEELEKTTTKLSEKIKKLQKDYDTLTTEKSQSDAIVEKLKSTPEAFKNISGFKKLAKLIERSENYDNLCDNPDLIDPESNAGKLIAMGNSFIRLLEKPENLLNQQWAAKKPLTELVRKGFLLDKVKGSPDLIIRDNEFSQTKLKTVVECLDKPEQIVSSGFSDKGLYKLIKDIQEFANSTESYEPGGMRYKWLVDTLSKKIINSNRYINTLKIANAFDKDSDVNALEGSIKDVFQKAKSYLQLDGYKNYWRNLQNPLFNTLNQLSKFKNDEKHNMRALIFYASQLYSIACVMNEAYGDDSVPTKRHKINISAFNTDVKPTMGAYGFPQPSQDLLETCAYESKNRSDEEEMCQYLSTYKPLPFIFINYYYGDDVLS